MNSLGICVMEVKENQDLKIHYTVLPDVYNSSEFNNCFYLHDINDSSQISIGTVKIERTMCLRVDDLRKEFRYDYYINSLICSLSPYQIVTVVEYEPTLY